MVISITKSELSNKNEQESTTERHPKNDASYSLAHSDLIESCNASYLYDDSNNNSSFDDDDDSIEENLKASIENCNIFLTSSLSNDYDDDEDSLDYSILDDDDDDNESIDINMILCDVDSDTVPSTDLQSSCLGSTTSDADDYVSITSSSSITDSTTNAINSRKEVYLKIIRNETKPSSIKYKRSCSDDVFNISCIFSKENNYYGNK